MKIGKAARLDGIANEVWKYREEVRELVGDFCNKVWRGERWPEG